MNLSQFKTKLETIAKQANKHKETLHELALFALAQNLYHGNIDPASKMLETLPNTINKRGLAMWFVEYGQFAIKDGIVTFKKSAAKAKAVENQLEKARAMPFWEFSTHTEGEVKAINFQSLLVSIIAKAKREAAKGEKVEGMELLEKIEAGLSETIKEEVQKRAVVKAK